ncbi:MAG TPA: hypothetical protein VF219_19150 [Vicinamibacterales bacterium]
MSQLVFLTFFLGLVSGRQTVALNAGPSIRSVSIVLDGQQVASLSDSPFQTTIDLGPRLAPRDLVAIGFDATGHEVARASQILNVPHPAAEATILIANENGKPAAEVRWMHKDHEQPSVVLLTVDDSPLPLDKANRATLPQLDPAAPHVIEAEVRFPSGDVARHALTVSGDVYSGSIDSELTAIVVRGSAPQEPTGSCFSSGGRDLRVSAVEKSRAVVILVKDPDSMPVMRAFARDFQGPAWPQSPTARTFALLDENTSINILWPAMEIRKREDNPTIEVYPATHEIDTKRMGVLSTLTLQNRLIPHSAPRTYAGAVAVAGLMAAEQGTRRAVVLLLESKQKDESTRQPPVVRDYLRSIGVPLHVWSLGPATKEQRAAWGEIENVETPPQLLAAVSRLRRDLFEQSVVWLATDAWHALHASVNAACNVRTVADDH